ncbi:restriction endonuclease [Thalassomonas actiniarum]|uniref:Restriction endonuclease n=1 Tax=Thalassomonas actiniarum TaxID=485447 RepID=A0AAF0C1V5_9GAMM|nr:restriction endonuclease [Thalassomonas actiniarum]WDD97104.1 restriction endonuclease [Thalassomonas actiniarum]
MTHQEYEQHVSNIIKNIESFNNATIATNKKIAGVQQPGHYEIDVSVTFQIDDILSFHLIIECKKWQRPVDRPVVQKLVQTRGAIAAHKAAIVSPSGFTKEAVAVAKAHGIALWVIHQESESIDSVMACREWAPRSFDFDRIKHELLDLMQVKATPVKSRLIDFPAFSPATFAKGHFISSRSAIEYPSAKTAIAQSLVEFIYQPDNQQTLAYDNIQKWLNRHIKKLHLSGMPLDEAEKKMLSIVKGTKYKVTVNFTDNRHIDIPAFLKREPD